MKKIQEISAWSKRDFALATTFGRSCYHMSQFPKGERKSHTLLIGFRTKEELRAAQEALAALHHSAEEESV